MSETVPALIRPTDALARPAPVEDAPVTGYYPNEAAVTEERRDSSEFAATLKRRWLLILSTWFIIATTISVVVWTRLHEEYEAVGLVRVAPTIPRILFRDEDNSIGGFYGAFLNTQMQSIVNRDVLSAAVQMPQVKALDWNLSDAERVDYLAKQLKTDNPANTELISLTLTGSRPKALAPLVNAVLQAYMRKVQRLDETADMETLELLYKKQADLEAERKIRHDELYDLAGKLGSLSLGGQQDAANAGMHEIQVELKKAQAGRVAAEARLQTLKQQGPMPLSGADMEQLRQEIFARDTDLASLSYSRQTDNQKLLDYAQRLGPDHREVKAVRERVDQEDKLIGERQTALNQIVGRVAEYRAKVVHETDIRQAEYQVAEASQREQALQNVLQDDLASLRTVGRNAVQLESLREKADETKALYQEVCERIQHLEMEKQRPARVSIDALAAQPETPARDKRPKLTILATGVGLFISMLLALLVDSRDTRVRSEEDLRRRVGLNILGTRTIPTQRSLGSRAVVASIAEEIRSIRGCVLFAGGVRDMRTLLITSPNPQEGKTRMSGDLAVALAESGRRILLIDGDNRKRDLTRQFGAEGRPGLADLLCNGHKCSDFVCTTSTAGLSFLPSGDLCEEFSELLVRPSKIDCLLKAADDYDLVIIDTPPVLLSNEPGIWARHVDSILMVVRAQHSAREDAIIAKERLSQMGGRIMGAVLNGAPPRSTYCRHYVYGEP